MIHYAAILRRYAMLLILPRHAVAAQDTLRAAAADALLDTPRYVSMLMRCLLPAFMFRCVFAFSFFTSHTGATPRYS